MPTETTKKLQKFGLSEKEADIYLALLQLGAVPAGEVAKKSGVNRSTAYVILESLAKKGLAAISIRDGVRDYSSASPERLVQKAETSAKEFEQLAELGREMISELKTAGSNEQTKPEIKFLDGAEGIKTAYEDILSSKETVLAYASEEVLHHSLPDYLPELRKRQATKGVRAKIISHDTSATREIIAKNKSDNIEYFLAQDNDFGSELATYGNKTAFISPREKFACVIESAEFAKGIKALFNLSLQTAKPWNVKAESKTQKHTQKKHPALVKAEKRFWGI